MIMNDYEGGKEESTDCLLYCWLLSWHGASTQSTLCPRMVIDSGFAIPSRTDNRLHNPSNDFKTKYYVEKEIIIQQKVNSMLIELFSGIYKFLAKETDDVESSR